MEEDIKDLIQRKIWTVESALSEARVFVDNVTGLPSEARKNIPIFPGEWSENKVKTYLKQLDAAVRNPLRYKNKRILEDNGVSTTDIPEKIFEDSTGIEEIVKLLLEAEKEFTETVVSLIKTLVSIWLKDGIVNSKEKLSEVLSKKIAVKRIFEVKNENLRNELLRKSMEDTAFLPTAESLVSMVEFVEKFGISAKYSVSFDRFENNLRNVHQRLVHVQEEYHISKEELSKFLKDQTLLGADEILEKKTVEYSERKKTLLEEWAMYSVALKSIGKEVGEPPQGIRELEKDVKALERKCLESLGKEGLRLLKFLRGEEDFPDEISKEGIKKALQLLRPLFARLSRQEGTNGRGE